MCTDNTVCVLISYPADSPTLRNKGVSDVPLNVSCIIYGNGAQVAHVGGKSSHMCVAVETVGEMYIVGLCVIICLQPK